jgi:hypothetical protein
VGWPRLWGKGNFATIWPAAIHQAASVATNGLLVTDLWMWLRRRHRKRSRAMAGKTAIA